MKDNRIYDRKPEDDFGRLIGDKLEDHRMPVDDKLWSAIAGKVEPKQKKNIWLYIGAAAAIIGVLFVVNPFSDLSNDKLTEVVAETPIIESKNDDQSSVDQVEAEDTIEPKLPTKQYKPKPKKEVIATEDKKLITEEKYTADQDTIYFIPEEELVAAVQQNDDIVIDRELTQQEKDSIAARKKAIADISLAALQGPNMPDTLVDFIRKDARWTLGLAMNAGSGVSMMSSEDGNIYLDNSAPGSGIGSGGGDFANALKNEDWDIDAKMPVSVGFMVKRNFNRTFSLESGLVYTYLSSNLSREVGGTKNGMSQKGSLKLHYLGIPLNVTANLWTDQKWSIYLSGGGMLEKGLSAREKMRTFKNGEMVEDLNLNSTWLSGVQWSINGALGVSYKLTRTWEIYFEPGVSYYFDSNQLPSMRTEKPTMFNLNAGIKFNLK